MTAPADFSSSLASNEVNANARQVGVVYAKALFAAAKKAGNLDEVAADFEAVMSVLESHPTFLGLARSGMISGEDRAAMYGRAFEGKAAPLFVSFLRTIAKHGRAQYLRAVFRAFREMNDERTSQVRIEVTTASKLDDAVGKRMAENLQKSLGRKPIFDSRVDSALIGGVMLRIGDTVYDGSVATQLENIRTQMIDRTVHEIQSRRDRFRSAEGN
jgi:F-type H+-transporting ATPase subunit delta